MGTAVQTTDKTSVRIGPAMLDRTFSDLLAWHQAAIERHGGIVETTRPADRASRQALTARYDDLHRALSPAARDRYAVALAVTELLTAFQRRPTGAEAKATVSKYVEVLSDRPAWAVQRACWAIARGEVEGISLDIPPAAPRLRDAVNKILEPFFVEAAQIREVLHAQVRRVPNEAERKLMQARFEQLLGELRAKSAVEDDRRAKAAERLGRTADRLAGAALEEKIDDQDLWP